MMLTNPSICPCTLVTWVGQARHGITVGHTTMCVEIAA